MSVTAFFNKKRQLYELNTYLSSRRFKYGVDYTCEDRNVKFLIKNPPDSGVTIYCKEKNVYKFIYISQYILIESSNVLYNLMIDANCQYLYFEFDTYAKFKTFSQLLESIFIKLDEPVSVEFLYFYNFYDMKHLLFRSDIEENEIDDFLGDYDIGPLRESLICKPVKSLIIKRDYFVTLTNQGTMIIWGPDDKSEGNPYGIERYIYSEKYVVNIYKFCVDYNESYLLFIDNENNVSFYNCTEKYVDVIQNANLLNKKIVQVKVVSCNIFYLYSDGTIEHVLGIDYDFTRIRFPDEFTDGSVRVKKLFGCEYCIMLITDTKVYVTDKTCCVKTLKKSDILIKVHDVTSILEKLDIKLDNIVKIRGCISQEGNISLMILDYQNRLHVYYDNQVKIVENVKYFFYHIFNKILLTNDNNFLKLKKREVVPYDEFKTALPEDIDLKNFGKLVYESVMISLTNYYMYYILTTRNHKIYSWKSDLTSFKVDFVESIETPFT